MDFREYVPIREGDEVVLVGTIRDPVNWDFSIRICEDDIAGVTRLVFSKPMLGLLLRRLFRRNRNHWTQEYTEHREDGSRRRVASEKKAADRIAAYEEARLGARSEAANGIGTAGSEAAPEVTGPRT